VSSLHPTGEVIGPSGPSRLGLWPFSMSFVNSFGGSFVVSVTSHR